MLRKTSLVSRWRMVWADGGAAAEPEAVAELGLELGLGLTLSTCDQEGQKDAVCPTGVWTAGRVRTQKRLSRGPFSVGPVLGFCILFSSGKWGGSVCSRAQGRTGLREPVPLDNSRSAVHCRTEQSLGTARKRCSHSASFSPTQHLVNERFLQSQPLNRKNDNHMLLSPGDGALSRLA